MGGSEIKSLILQILYFKILIALAGTTHIYTYILTLRNINIDLGLNYWTAGSKRCAYRRG